MSEITELEMLDPDRVDGVGTPANGTPFLMLKQLGDDYEALCKAKYDAKALRRLKSEGHTLPGTTSYPIDDEEDLHNAIHAVGRGNADHDAIRRYIMRRAKEMGKTSMIPDDWQSDGSIAKAAPSQAAGQRSARTPNPSSAAAQTSEMHPDAGPKHTDNAQPGGLEMPHETGSGDPEADAEGYGDTAPDKALPMGEAQSQTRAVNKAGSQDGRGDIVGEERGEDELEEAEDEEQPADNHHGHVRNEDTPAMQRSMKAKGSADSDPGSPAWEHKDVALAEKAEDLLNQALTVVRQFGQREKDEAAKAGRRLSAKSEHAIRAAIQALQDLLDTPDSTAHKELSQVTTDELIKLLDERDARQAKEAKKADRKAAKKAEKAQKKHDPKRVAKKALKEAEKAGERLAKSVPDGVDGDAIKQAVTDAVKAAVEPLSQRLEQVESQPAQGGPLMSGAGLAGTPFAVAMRGDAGQQAAAMKDLQARFDAAPVGSDEKAKLGTELTKARLTAFENMRGTGFAPPAG